MKRYLYIIIDALIGLSAQAASYTTATIDNITYRLYDELSEAHVYHDKSSTFITVTDNRLELPEKVTNGDKEYTVTEIEYFRCGNTALTLVTPSTVKSIKYVKKGVKKLVLGKGVTSIMYTDASENLESFEVAEGNEYFSTDNNGILYSKDKKILWYVPYAKRSSMGSFTVPSTVEDIAGAAFYGFNQLETVVLPEGLKYIRNHAFYKCNKLINCHLPSTVESIAEHAFDQCNLSGLELPAQLKSIGEYAFYYGVENDRLASLVIPQHVEKIEGYAFSGVTIEKVYAHCVPFVLSNNDPLGNPSNQTLIVPKGTREIFSTREGWKRINKVIEGDFEPTFNVADYLPGSTSLDSDGQAITQDGVSYKLYNSEVARVCCRRGYSSTPAYDVTAGNTLVIPESVYFRGKDYPVDGVEYFETYNNTIVDLQLPNTVTFVKNVKSGVKILKLPKNVTSVSYLHESVSLENFEVADGNEYFSTDNNGILYSKDKKILWYVPYAKRSSMGSFTVPSTVEDIAGAAFYGFNQLETVVLPEGLKYIRNHAFYKCNKLINCHLPSTVESIAEHAFDQCNLSGLELPAQLKSIGEYAFYYGVENDRLASLVIPQHVEKIEGYAFSGVTIEKVYAHCVPFVLSNNDPLGNPSNQTLIVPKGTREIFSTREGWKRINKVIEGDFEPTFNVADYLPGSTSLDSDGQAITQDGVSYKLYNSEVARVCCRRGYSSTPAYDVTAGNTLVIPESVYFRGKDYPVDGVEYFETYNNTIVDLQLPNTVTFVNNVKSGVKILKLPKSVTSVTGLHESVSLEGFEVAEGNEYFSVDESTGVLYSKDKTKLHYAPYAKRGSFGTFTVPSTVTYIGRSAFYGFDQLSRVTLSEGLKQIDNYAFYNCTSLFYCKLPSTVEIIGADTFSGCNLNGLELPAQLKSIGEYAFSSAVVNNKLDVLTIPQYVESIGAYAFTSIEISLIKSRVMQPMPINDVAFYSNSATPLLVPTGTIEEYKVLTGWKRLTKISESDELLPQEEQCATPSIQRQGNTLTITTTTAGATIYYTLDGTTPTQNSSTYTSENPIVVTQNCTVKAIAIKEGIKNSTVAEFYVDWFTVAKPQIRINDELLVEMTTETPDAVIRYVVNGETDPDETSVIYQRPLYLPDNCTIKAIATKEHFNNSEVATFELNWDQFTCPEPVIRLSGTLVYISTSMVGARIYYTIDGIEPNENSEQYTGEPIELTNNCTVMAITVKEGYHNSNIASKLCEPFVVASPEFNMVNGKLEITCSNPPEAEIYYGIGLGENELPSIRYTEPITLIDNHEVKAIAKKEGFKDSPVASYIHNQVTCEAPSLSNYDGRYFKLNVPEGATVYYAMTPDLADAKVYDERGEVQGTGTLYCQARHPYKNASKIKEIGISYFYDGEGYAEVTASGVLNQAFEWNGTADVTTLAVSGPLDATDIAFIKNSLPSLQHLNLENTNVASRELPTEAFAGMESLVSFVSPKNLVAAGDRILADCPQLAAVKWWPSVNMKENTFGDQVNQNMLVYVLNAGFAPSKVRNKVANGTASSIILSDPIGDENANFYCLEDFMAKKIIYTHYYGQETEIGTCKGWETIALPFTVQKIEHSSNNGEMMPFKKFEEAGQPEEGRPFWLRALTENGFEDAGVIEAQTPYIISMPNNAEYAERFNLKGNVTFSAENAVIVRTRPIVQQKNAVSFVPCFLKEEKNGGVWAINKNEEYGGQPAGSGFIAALRDVMPFEAYATNDVVNAPQFLSITDLEGATTGIYDVLYGRNQRSEETVRVYNLSGVLISTGTRPEVMPRLQKGIYIVNGQKIVVK